LQSISQAKYFLLVLTTDRCLGDDERKDWVSREIVAAFESNCKIIPIIDNFQWPLPEDLLKDINGVRWVHDYQVRCDTNADLSNRLFVSLFAMTKQDAYVGKLDKFMRGDAYGKFDQIHGRRMQDGVLTPFVNSRFCVDPPVRC
jgi:hypothetical protein